MLNINNLEVKINNKIVINKLNLIVKKGEIHILMGANGSGKSSLVNTLAGNKKYIINKGKIIFKKKIINNLDITTRAREGIFISFQYPIELPGITNKIFLKNSINSIYKYKKKKIFDNYNFISLINKNIKKFDFKLCNDWLNKYVNVELSGGQKKQNDILQMLILKPTLCILDEIDSGLDLDFINLLVKVIKFLNLNKLVTFIIITHYQKIIEKINVNYIHLLDKGNIVKSGNKLLGKNIEKYGYSSILKYD